MNKHELEEQDMFFPGTYWHEIEHGVEWRNYRHWGQGVWSGEGLEKHDGDGSGCVMHIPNFPIPVTLVPTVVQARMYVYGNSEISSVFSYPHGIAFEERYFWEIYIQDAGEIERFYTEQAMEERVVELLTGMKIEREEQEIEK